MAILRKKAEALHIELAEDVLGFLAQRVRTNVRRLEGVLIRVASYLSPIDLIGQRFWRMDSLGIRVQTSQPGHSLLFLT